MKAVRRIVENDLGLPKKQLDEQKDVVTALVDQVCTAAAVVSSCTCAVLAGVGAAWYCRQQKTCSASIWLPQVNTMPSRLGSIALIASITAGPQAVVHVNEDTKQRPLTVLEYL
jgi:hypothetical protein